MRRWLRSVGTLVCFLLLLLVIVSQSRALDKWILLVVWGAFLIATVVLIVRNARSLRGGQGVCFGQLALLPRKWRRWVLDERDPPNEPRA